MAHLFCARAPFPARRIWKYGCPQGDSISGWLAPSPARYGDGMERWHIPSIASEGRREPRVLFSSDEARAVVIDLRAGEQLGEHSVHERAVLQVISGQVS